MNPARFIVPFLGLLYSSVFVPWKIRRDSSRDEYPWLYGEGPRRMTERKERRYDAAHRTREETYERSAVGVTYEDLYRREAAFHANPLMHRALLRYEDWLLSQLMDVAWTRHRSLDELDRARRHEGLAALWLSALLAYLVWLSAST